MRRLLAQAQWSLRQHCEKELGGGDRQADWGLEPDLSTSSLDGLLQGGTSSMLLAFEAPEALLPQLAAAAAPDVLPGAMPAVLPLGLPGGGRSSGPATDVLASKAPLQLPQLGALKHSPPPLSSPAADWQFEDPDTAAAFMQLRQRQAAAARKRALQQQRRDPAARLHEFQLRNGAALPSCSSGPCSQRVSSGGSGTGSSGRGGGRSGSGCGTLPSLRSPRAVRAARQVAVGVRTFQLDG